MHPTSQPTPLSLSINLDNERMNPDTLLEAVFNVAGKYQWKSISYKSNKIAEFIPFFDGRFNLGQVRSLSIRLSLTCVDREEQGIFELDLPGGVVDMRPFTHLRSLNLNFEEEINITKVLVPWGQLTDLKLTSSIDSRLCLSILRHCTNLETCELHPKTYKDRKIEKYKQPVRLPQLKQLRIITSSDIPAMLVDNLQCPALQDASFHYDYDEERNYSFLLSFIENCRETLLKLELPGLITDEFIEMQGHLNVLEELTITGRFGWPETFEDLMDGRADRPYDAGMRAFFQDLKRRPETLPKLKVLRILDQRPEEKSSVGREVAQFIDSRLANCKDSAPLHIVFRLNKDASEEQRKLGQKYRKWRAQGFTMDFE
ncbi:hypothetical protein NLJ89_g1607 [Agrocybe chaxingu]|uniref:Uncharacterized protein n=1 Tax=Agrocybe chaxingu TaxID=84603 RepID=A0A9W8MZQ6_9AGAR|nr:hypothetical protein NLJ89_g1607 [Agrocybe chaxingu]